jgi:hypothetical protein
MPVAENTHGPWQQGWLWVVGYLALFVSVVLAVRFAYGSADTMVDAMIRAGAAATAAIVGCQGPAWIFRSLRLHEWGTALLASLGFSICLTVTLAGGIGTIAAGSDKLLATRAKASVTYADMRKELESLRDKRGNLPAHRPVGTIQSELTAARVDRRWSSSSSCADATATASRVFCADYARLQGELETSKAATDLDVKIQELTRKLATSPSVRAVHPQAEVIARLLGIAPEDAEAWYAFLFALSVEMASMTVLLIAETTTQHRVISVLPVPLTPVVQRRERVRIMEHGRVIDWLRERAVPGDDTTATALEVLHADYEAWCTEMELTTASMEAFADEFDRVREIPELAGNIRKRGNRYYGIKLADTTVPRLRGL